MTLDHQAAQPKSALLLVAGDFVGEILACDEGLSFWGGVDPATGRIIDAHHPNHGESVGSKVLMMPTSRGSCSGSGVLLELALAGVAPAALIFRDDEEVLTLGALVSDRIFGKTIPTLRLSPEAYAAVRAAPSASLRDGRLVAGAFETRAARADVGTLHLEEKDRALLDGAGGEASRTAMEILCLMAVSQGAARLMDVTRGHIDGCILAHSANLIFAEKLADMGARVVIPTTINAISVDRENWRSRGVPPDFGERASRLADAYVRMGARPTFTCAPYLLGDAPRQGECIGWSESNAVIFANSVLGARTAKHPDYLDLCIAMTGRAPVAGAYTDEGRAPRRIVEFSLPDGACDDALWPLIGWLAGKLSPGRVPLLTGLEAARPGADGLKALCAAFGTTSGAPMLHVAGHTPEADMAPAPDADRVSCGPGDLAAAWSELNGTDTKVDLIAIGSPHVSAAEARRFADLLDGRPRHEGTEVILTIGRDELDKARAEGTAGRLEASGVELIPDLCWCSITEPVFPAKVRVLMTNSGKYAHYAFGLSGRKVRFGSLADCAESAVTGQAPAGLPQWLKL
jgi:predicted aconitase/predicted aconitase with swiveling domain